MQGMDTLVESRLALSSKRNDPRLSRKYKEVRLRKLAEDGWTCFYCGYEGKDMTIDHIIPVSKAPELAIEMSNMVSCCKPCNSSKGSRSQGVFLERKRTPPDFPGFPSPTRSKLHEDSPFTARPVQN
jgi:5-methylcytosine-specific restriction endonuclease McrA